MKPVTIKFVNTRHACAEGLRYLSRGFSTIGKLWREKAFSPLCTSWMLILVFTYKGRVRRYSSEPLLAFPWTEVSEAAQLSKGYTSPRMPDLYVIIIRIAILYIVYTTYMTEAPRVCTLVPSLILLTCY